MAINLTSNKGINLTPGVYRPADKKKALNFSLTEVAVLLVMIGLFSWYMILPMQASLQANKAQIQKLEDDKGKIEGEIKGMEDSVSALAASKTDIAEMDEAVPLDSRTTKLQMLVRSLSGQAGVSLEAVSFEENSQKVYAADKEAIKNPFSQIRSLKKISGSVAVLGTFDQVREFISKIENSARVLNIISMDLNLQKDSVMSLKLDLEAYSYE